MRAITTAARDFPVVVVARGRSTDSWPVSTFSAIRAIQLQRLLSELRTAMVVLIIDQRSTGSTRPLVTLAFYETVRPKISGREASAVRC
jgi:hypothetical protein